MRAIAVILLFFTLVTNSFAGQFTVETPKGTFYVKEIIYFQDSKEWFVLMSPKEEGPYFETLLPCNWVTVKESGKVITEEIAASWPEK